MEAQANALNAQAEKDKAEAKRLGRLMNLQIGEVAIPVGAAIAGGVASGAAGAAFCRRLSS